MALGICVSPCINNIWHHVFGSSQNSYGVLHLAWCVFALTAIPSVTRPMFYSSCIFIAVFVIINVVSNPFHKLVWVHNWHPFFFMNIFGALALFPLAYAIHNPIKHKNFWLAGIILCIYLSNCKTLLLGIMLTTPIYFLRRYINTPKYVAVTLCACIPLAVIVIEWAVFRHNVINHPVLTDFIVYEKSILLSTLHSRFLTLKAIFHTFMDHPWRILCGFGFGTSGELMLQSLTKLPVQIYQDGVLNPSWGEILKIEFHSYHGLVEALISMGVGGLIIQLYIWLLPILRAKPEKRLITTLVMSLWIFQQSTWFTIELQWLFDIFFLRTVMPNNQPSLNIQHTRTVKWLSFIFVPIAGLLIHMMICFNHYNNILHTWFGAPARVNQSFYRTTQTYGEAQRLTFIQNTVTYDEVRTFLIHTQKYFAKPFTESLNNLPFVTVWTRLRCFAWLAQNNYLSTTDETNWEETAIYAMSAYPHRFDIIYSYANWLYKNTIITPQKCQGQLQTWLTTYPNNPVWQYFHQKSCGQDTTENFKQTVNILKKWLPINNS